MATADHADRPTRWAALEAILAEGVAPDDERVIIPYGGKA